MRGFLIEKVKESIKILTGFDIGNMESIEAVSGCKVPCVILHSVFDQLVSIEHSKRIF